MDGDDNARRPARRWRSAILPIAAALSAAAVTFVVVDAVVGDGAPQPRTPPATAGGVLDDDVAAGRAVFARMDCGTCHRLSAANASGQIAPDLDTSLRNHDRASLVAKIVDPYPNGVGDAFPTMPEDYGRVMTADELAKLVDFLLAARDGGSGQQ
jgi:mono/diheme cytochrome c family protein